MEGHKKITNHSESYRQVHGVVIKSSGSRYKVRTQDAIVECIAKGKFRLQGIESTNLLAVGDEVLISYNSDTTWIVQKVLPRKNYIIRKSVNLSKRHQVIAANIDRAYLMVTVKYPVTFTGFIDRFLVSAEAYKVPVTILFNKRDLYTTEELEKMNMLKECYERIGYTCYSIVANSKKDTLFLEQEMYNQVNLLSGHSGTGKSTLINTLIPKLSVETKSLSESRQLGQHTTTFAEMYPLPKGGYIADTPGIKGFGLVDNISREELSHFFVEIFKISNLCKFYNCTHLHEPSCAVIGAVEKGEIAQSRYTNYVSMMTQDDEKYR